MGGYVYHVLNRGVGRLRIFRKERDFEAFEEVLEQAKARLPIRVLGWCVMTNHWHFVQRLKALCPGMGQVKMAQTLARAGLHLGATTKGPQFWREGFKDWCHRKGIKPPRCGAVGKHGSISVIGRTDLNGQGSATLLTAGATSIRSLPSRGSTHDRLVR